MIYRDILFRISASRCLAQDVCFLCGEHYFNFLCICKLQSNFSLRVLTFGLKDWSGGFRNCTGGGGGGGSYRRQVWRELPKACTVCLALCRERIIYCPRQPFLHFKFSKKFSQQNTDWYHTISSLEQRVFELVSNDSELLTRFLGKKKNWEGFFCCL